VHGVLPDIFDFLGYGTTILNTGEESIFRVLLTKVGVYDQELVEYLAL
jgi:hypothetical protein